MAGSTRSGSHSDNSDLHCKKCKNKVVNFVKCITCNAYFHSSCAKNLKCVIIDKHFVNCCEKSDEVYNTEDDINAAFFDAMDNLTCENKIDISIFKYIVKQKDAIIAELNDKVRILNEQLSDAKRLFVVEKTPKHDKKYISSIKDTTPARYELPGASENLNGSSGKIQENNITLKDINKAVLETETRIMCDKFINMERPPANIETNEVRGEKQWKKVEGKRTKRKSNDHLVVGNFSGETSIKGVENYLHLHVYNLQPNTAKDDLLKFLSPNFPGVKCDSLQSRHPDRYSSFKVSISRNQMDLIKNPTNWPKNAYVRHFFQRKQIVKPQP